jgi:hypothetical protein
MRTHIALVVFATLIASGSSAVLAEDTLRLCVKQGGQVRAIGPTEACGNGESLVEAGGALRFIDADARAIGPWVDLNGRPICASDSSSRSLSRCRSRLVASSANKKTSRGSRGRGSQGSENSEASTAESS